jgi:hypothetical protein
VTVPSVTIEVDPAQVDSAVFSTLPRPTSVAVTVSHAGAALIEPFPVCRKNFFVAVIFPARFTHAFPAEA